MNEIIPKLPSPLDTIVIENEKGSYKSFNVAPGSDFPLQGVTYPVEYGYIPGYTGEDGHDLDFFVGSVVDGLVGTIKMYRPDVEGDIEHKFYVALTDGELAAILTEFQLVLRGQHSLANHQALIDAIQEFKNT